MKCLFWWIVVIVTATCCNAVELNHTDIIIVNNETRYQAQHPGCVLNLFEKKRHAKGSYIFNKGCRIPGDRLLLNFSAKDKFSTVEDLQVLMRYPSVGEAATITAVEILAGVGSQKADTFFVGDGGIDKQFCEILLQSNDTDFLEYELFLYGYGP